MPDDIIVLCSHCIDAIRSHGEPVIVLHESDYEEYMENFGEELVCEWCELNDTTLYDCVFE